MNFLKPKLLEKMKFSIFNGKSYYGYNPSILKSGICKYYRRNEVEKFKWCVYEMLLFGFNTKGKALVTNLLNRLKILLMEDMSVIEIDRTFIGINKIIEFEDSGRNDYNKIMEFCDLVIFPMLNWQTCIGPVCVGFALTLLNVW